MIKFSTYLNRCIATIALCCTLAPAHASNALRVEGAAGQLLGEGQIREYGDGDATFSGTCSAELLNVTVDGAMVWEFSFKSPQGEPLLLNDLYEGAARYPLQSSKRPGQEITANQINCNESQGRFIVRELQCSAGNLIEKLAIDAAHSCDPTSASPLRAYLRINSSVPLVVAKPTASAGVDIAVSEGSLVQLDGSKSSGPSGVANLAWQQVGGPAVTLSSSTGPSPSFAAPAIATGGAILAFDVTATGGDGLSDSNRVNVHVRDAADAQTRLTVVSHPGADVGKGISRTLSLIDSSVTSSCTSTYAWISLHNGDFWSTTLAAASGSSLLPGTYEDARRYPANLPNSPGLDLSGAGSGCNALRGRYVIHEFACVNDVVQTLAVDIEQRCWSESAPALPTVFAYLRVNSAVPLPAQVDRGCRLDVDGDGLLTPSVDSSTLSRGLAGYLRAALEGDLPPAPGATRYLHRHLEPYFQNTCGVLANDIGPPVCSLDLDGDGKIQLTTDGVIATRLIAGLSGDTVLANATGAGASRTSWAQLAPYLAACKLLPAP